MLPYFDLPEEAPISQVDRDNIYQTLVDSNDDLDKLLFAYLEWLEEQAENN